MKKLAVLVAIMSLVVVAAPAFSATNPFMDVPLNHWAYDAIGQLAAHGILSGYPDGTYKGQQQTTRYEMASALARALAVVDMTKASKQDVEMLKRLVVEFKDELEALGVRVDELDERVAVLENRLGGWHISGVLALDLVNQSANNAADLQKSDGKFEFDDAKLIFERTWGENDDFYFRGRLNGGAGGNVANFDRFYVEMPFFFDTKLMVGRNNWAWEGAYKIDNTIKNTGGWNGDQLLTDWTWTGLGLTKNFGLGTASIAFAHPDAFGDRLAAAWQRAWMILAGASLQFTEQIGFDLGGQVFVGDNAEQGRTLNDEALNSLWTVFGGLRFNFNDNVALKGVFYYQKINAEHVTANGWQDYGYGIVDGNSFVDNANHWAAIIDVKQEALKYTSLWLEYGQFKQGFIGRSDAGIFFSGSPVLTKAFLADADNAAGVEGGAALDDIKYWRVGLGQEWNEQWATHIFYYGYNVAHGKNNGADDAKPYEVGAGVQYKMNDYTTMGLNYVHVDNNLDGNDTKDNVIRFRTKVTF